jgi:tetratricopeptide (TPR) repeat protein
MPFNLFQLELFEQPSFEGEGPFGTASDSMTEFSVHETTNVARRHEDEGNLAEAAVEYLRVLEWYTKLGNYNPTKTLQIQSRLVCVYRAQAQLEKAANIYRQVLAGYEKILKALVSETLRATYGLAKVLEQQEEYAEAELLYREAVGGFEKLGLVEDQLNCQSFLGDMLRDQGRYGEAINLLSPALAGYTELGLKHRIMGVIVSILEISFQIYAGRSVDSTRSKREEISIQLLETFSIAEASTMSKARSLLEESLEMDHEISPEFLVEGIHLASIYSDWEDVTSAQSIFESVLPKLELLSDAKYDLEKAYAYLEFGLHHQRQGVWKSAVDYLSMAYEGLAKLKESDESLMKFVKMCLIEVQLQVEHSVEETKLKQQRFIDIVEAGREERRPKRHRQAKSSKHSERNDSDEEDVESDMMSCKYGITYSVGDITGISDSVFMVP